VARKRKAHEARQRTAPPPLRAASQAVVAEEEERCTGAMVELAHLHPQTARRLLQAFTGALKEYKLPHRRIVDHFTEAFERILDGDDPAKALGLKRERAGRPAEGTYLEWVAAFQRLRNKGYPREQALGKLLDLGVDRRRLEREIAETPALSDDVIDALLTARVRQTRSIRR
jgi:hypothetical protein